MKNPLPQLIGKLAVAAVTVFVVACQEEESRPSDQVGTDQTYVLFSVTARSSGPVLANAQLREGGAAGEPLRLAGGDSLWFSAGLPIEQFEATSDIVDALAETSGRVARMDEKGIADFEFLFLEFKIHDTPYYTETLNPAPENRYYLAYLRGNLSNSTNTYVSLPASFDITAPLLNETVSRTNDIVINWEASDEELDEVEIQIALTCDGQIRQSSEVILDSDSGTYTVPGGLLEEVAGRSCPLSIEITKRRLGMLDAGLNGGEATGQRVATVTVNSVD